MNFGARRVAALNSGDLIISQVIQQALPSDVRSKLHRFMRKGYDEPVLIYFATVSA
jgi:hypothetical protein